MRQYLNTYRCVQQENRKRDRPGLNSLEILTNWNGDFGQNRYSVLKNCTLESGMDRRMLINNIHILIISPNLL
jgi:hypothetical protein